MGPRDDGSFECIWSFLRADVFGLNVVTFVIPEVGFFDVETEETFKGPLGRVLLFSVVGLTFGCKQGAGFFGRCAVD
jgi:CO dehydrogenase/acetyl-CoA synthase beta subunit